MTNRSKKVARLAAIGTVAALTLGALGGCAGNSSSAKSSDSFTYWSSWNQNEPQAKVIQAAINEFTKETGIKVNVQWQGRQVMTKLTPTLRTGAAADLVDGTVNAVGPLVSTNQAEDLSSVYNMSVPGESKKVSDVIPEKYSKWLKSGDTTFMVPYSVSTEGIWYNSANYPDLAQNPPKTWDDMMSLFASVKAKGKTPLAMPSTDSYWVTLMLEREIGYDNLRKLASDKTGAAWDNPGVKDVASKFLAMRDAGYFAKGYESNQGNQAELDWAAGKAEFYLSGTWTPSETKPNVGSGFTYGSIQMPTINGGSTDMGVNFTGFAVPKTAKHKDAAEQFIAFFTQKTWMQKMATDATQISPRSDVSVPAELTSVSDALNSNALYPDQGRLSLDYSDWYTTVFQPLVGKVTVGKYTPEQFVSEGKQQTVAYWKGKQ